jgi:hypothetical protein
VPWGFQGDHIVSPARVKEAGSFDPLCYASLLREGSNLIAISSGCLIYLPHLLQIAIPRALWLDYVDHWTFAEVRKKHSLILAFDCSLQHNLWIFSLKSLTFKRSTSISNGEATLLPTLGAKARLIFPFRLVARVMR